MSFGLPSTYFGWHRVVQLNVTHRRSGPVNHVQGSLDLLLCRTPQVEKARRPGGGTPFVEFRILADVYPLTLCQLLQERLELGEFITVRDWNDQVRTPALVELAKLPPPNQKVMLFVGLSLDFIQEKL